MDCRGCPRRARCIITAPKFLQAPLLRFSELRRQTWDKTISLSCAAAWQWALRQPQQLWAMRQCSRRWSVRWQGQTAPEHRLRQWCAVWFCPARPALPQSSRLQDRTPAGWGFCSPILDVGMVYYRIAHKANQSDKHFRSAF